jgi:hypothetical protein
MVRKIHLPTLSSKFWLQFSQRWTVKADNVSSIVSGNDGFDDNVISPSHPHASRKTAG